MAPPAALKASRPQTHSEFCSNTLEQHKATAAKVCCLLSSVPHHGRNISAIIERTRPAVSGCFCTWINKLRRHLRVEIVCQRSVSNSPVCSEGPRTFLLGLTWKSEWSRSDWRLWKRESIFLLCPGCLSAYDTRMCNKSTESRWFGRGGPDLPQ